MANGEMISLAESLRPLKDRFNQNKDKARLITLLSPTWPMWYEMGTRAVRQAVAEQFPKAQISISVIWLPIMETDGPEAAQKVLGAIPDPRAQHFWDPEKSAGKAIAKSVGYDGRVAWDFYLFYPPGAEWQAGPPEPAVWMYQPSDDWTEPEHMREGEALMVELTKAMKKVAVPYDMGASL
jgi:hypothetical protein